MTTPYYHGLRIDVNAESTAADVSGQAAIAIIVTADDVDDTLFPENTAIQLPDFSDATLNKCGTTGTQKTVITTFTSQGLTPKVVLVRVEESDDDAVLEDNVIAGIAVLKAASNDFDFSFKLIAAPGLENIVVGNALGELAAEIGAFSYVALKTNSATDAITARGSFDHKHVGLLYPRTATLDGADVHLAALAIATRVMVDNMPNTTGGIGRSISNIKLKGGVDALSEAMDYKAVDSKANTLNAAHITTLVKMANGDFRFRGSRTSSTDARWAFETDTRIGALIEEMITHHFDNNDVIDSAMKSGKLRFVEQSLTSKVINFLIDEELIIDGVFSLDNGSNTQAEMEQGIIHYQYDFGTYKPMEQVKVHGLITAKYLPSVIANIA